MSHGVVEKKKNGEEGGCTSPPPPDGGWGWVVVFASFMIHIVNDGITYSFGIFFTELLQYFNEGKGKTAWIASILAGVTLCAGPISSVFVNWYGCRLVSIWGGALAAVCVTISAFAPNVFTLFITIGVGTGLGFGLIYLPAIVCVTVYFEKYRSLATGIAVCGSGVGTFLFAPLTEWLISYYGWRGAMAIMGALILNCVVFGALFRPLETDVPYDFAEPPTEMTLLNSEKSQDQILNSRSNASALPVNGDSIQRSMSTDHMRHNSVVQSSRRLNGQQFPNGKFKNDQDTVRLALSQPMLNMNIDNTKARRSQSLRRVGSGIMHRPDVLYQGSLLNLSNRGRRVSLMNEDKNIMGKYGSRSSLRSQIQPPDGLPTTKDFKDTIATLLDISLFKDPIFILFTVSNFLTSVGFYIPYLYLVAQCEEIGIPKDQASYLLSIIGIANTIGRIILGYLSDKPWINRLAIYNSSLAICGISTIMSVLCKDFYSFAIYASVFGFTIGAYVGLTSVILVDLLGLERLTDAFGMLLLFQGVASVVGSPLAGSLYDALHSYDPGFYVAGVTILLSGLILFAIPPLQRWQIRKTQEAEALEEGEEIL